MAASDKRTGDHGPNACFRVYECGKAILLETPTRVLQHLKQPDIPAVLRIGERNRTFRVFQRFTEQLLVRRVAADDAIEGDNVGGRHRPGDGNEVPLGELDGVGSPPSPGLVGRCREIGARRIDDDRPTASAVERLECQRADACADIEDRPLDQSRAAEAIEKQARRGIHSLCAIVAEL
jgi:hypothetical protein